MKNTTCKTCGRKFHACSSCGLDHDWEWTYCSEVCYKNSKDYSELEKAQDIILTKLDKKQLKAIYTVFIDGEPSYDFERKLCEKIGEQY